MILNALQKNWAIERSDQFLKQKVYVHFTLIQSKMFSIYLSYGDFG